MLTIMNNKWVFILETRTDSFLMIDRIDDIEKDGDVLFSKQGSDLVLYVGEQSFKMFQAYCGIDVINKLLESDVYVSRSRIQEVDFETNSIRIETTIYKNIDLDSDPYINRRDFALIKTTKKDDGFPRQMCYQRVRSGDYLDAKWNWESYLVKTRKGFCLGELSNKAAEYLGELSNQYFIKYLDYSLSNAGNYVGNIRIYDVRKYGK